MAAVHAKARECNNAVGGYRVSAGSDTVTENIAADSGVAERSAAGESKCNRYVKPRLTVRANGACE
jgi:hypothetical protein